jgi:hypothetical protein
VPVSIKMAGLGLALLTAAPALAHAQGCVAPPNVTPLQSTPLTLRILQQSLIPVPATDGFVHLAYAAQATNLDRQAALIDEITPVDPLHGFRPTGSSGVVDMNGRSITGTLRPFKPPLVDGLQSQNPVDTRSLPGGGSGTGFFDVRYPNIQAVPSLLAHRLVVALLGHGGLTTELTDPIPVGCDAPVVLSPPLVGSRWWNGNGCCETISPHRGATLPLNGDIRVPEQFAIDFAQLTPDNTCCTGPVKQLSSWPFFGVPVLAAATGTVVQAVNDMPEQVPGPPVGVTAQNAAGNHIIEDIGGGRFIMYAHLKTNSIPARLLQPGAVLRVGQRLGDVGNTGSTTAPHLHFQVMDRPSTLNAIGLPFVFDKQSLEGHVAGTANSENDTYESGGVVRYVARDVPQTRLNEMPAETQVFGFNE